MSRSWEEGYPSNLKVVDRSQRDSLELARAFGVYEGPASGQTTMKKAMCSACKEFPRPHQLEGLLEMGNLEL